MKKSKIKPFSILAMLLFSLTSSTLLMTIEPVDGMIISMQWGQLESYGGYNATEKAIAEDVCDYIYNLFDYDYWGNWAPVNAYWDYTDTDGVETCMDYQNDASNSVTFVTNWWVGDFHLNPLDLNPAPFGHFWFYGDDDDIEDTCIHENANNFEGNPVTSKQKFNFIWTCANGANYWTDSSGNFNNITGVFYGVASPTNPPPTNTNDVYGIFDSSDSYACVGMPLAWTNRTDMSLNGYSSSSGSYTYIGFQANSPFMGDILPGTAAESTDNFPMVFYEAALGYHDPYYLHWDIDDSLDYASWDTYGCSFTSTDLYTGYWRPVVFGEDVLYFFCKMQVLGNGDMELPYS